MRLSFVLFEPMNEMSATGKSTPQASFLQKKHKKITSTYLENAGAYYLQRFSASISQFRQVMSRKIAKSCRDHPDQSMETCHVLLENVIQKFINLGYLNDAAYANALHASLQNKSFARSRIIRTMQQKGVPQDILQEILPEQNENDDLRSAIKWARRKKLGPYSLREKPNQQQRDLAAMARAGFSFECANKALRLPPEEAEDLLNT